MGGQLKLGESLLEWTWKILQLSLPLLQWGKRLRHFRGFSSNLEETVGLDSRVPVWSRVLLRLKLVLCSVAKLRQTVCSPIVFSTPGSPVLYYLPSLLRFMSTESMMCSNHYICHCPLVLLPSVFPSIRVFSNESRNSNSKPLFCWTTETLELFPQQSEHSGWLKLVAMMWEDTDVS